MLHVVVGHGLAGYFLNAVRSVRAVAPGDPVLVVDNASPDPELLSELRRMADGDGLINVIFRTENDVRQNRKVGSLYAAYEAAFDHALARQADFLHLIQGDFQTLWWDSDVVAKSAEIFAAHPRCVNLLMRANSRDMTLGDDFADTPGPDGLRALRWYGLTDTGLYHLGRWRAWGMRFGPTEREHSRRYLDEGLEVVFHPWPTDVPIPWPAVVRNGIQRGREIVTGKPFLIKPLPAAEVGRLKTAPDVWLESICVPWGWACATPIWGSDLDSIDYWVMRYRDARKNGIRHLFPRFELRGIDTPDRRKLIRRYQYRPSLFRLFVVCPARYAVRSLMHFQRTLFIPLRGYMEACVREEDFVSFIVIAYNEAANIAATIAAITALDGLGKHEVIVIDDGSRDETAGIVTAIAERDPDVRLIRLPENRGRGYARHTGVADARGDLIATVDADIILPRDWLVRTRLALQGHDAVGGTAVPDGDVAYLYRRFGLTPRVRAHSTTVAGGNGLYRSEVFASVRFDPALREGEDVALNHAIERRGLSRATVPGLIVEHREDKTWGESLWWMFDSGRGATRQLLAYRQIRQPDVATGTFTAAAVIGVLVAVTKRPAAGPLIPAAVVLAASAQHVRSRFQTPRSDWPRIIPAIAADSALLTAYFAGRLAGLAALRQRRGMRRCG